MCDTLVRVTDDGVLFAKNSDRDANEAQLLEWTPATTHATGSRARCTWIDVPQVRSTRATLISRPFWMWGAEIGTNDAGVTIGNEAVWTDQPVDDVGLTGMDLLRLALERAGTAHDAVAILIQLLDRHGQGGGCGHEHRSLRYHNSFLVADATEAWVVETAGRFHATERITHGARSISNGLTIPRFADAHADRIHDRATRCALRRQRTETAAAQAAGLADMIAALRDHGDGRGGDQSDDRGPRYSPLVGALSAPCAHPGGMLGSTQTTASWVAHLNGDGAHHLVTATAAPCTSLFKPVAVDDPLGDDVLGPEPDDHFDPATLWWRHELVHRRALRDPQRWLAALDESRRPIESAFLADRPTPREAFALAARWEDETASAITAAGIVAGSDRRPPLVRAFWRPRDRRAGFPPTGT